ncbi:UNVERIFIED_CONTAM: hypothetical protein FKN15_010446 [Acipenser sinensis]
MSRLIRGTCKLLGIKTIRTSVFHPQTDGLVERFNKTLKSMLRRFINSDVRYWDQLIPPLLFAIREVPQASTGFSPFELLYGRRPRGVLDLVREMWEEQQDNSTNTVRYVLDLRKRLESVGKWAHDNLQQAQHRQ